MSKLPSELEVGDDMYISDSTKYAEIVDIQPFHEILAIVMAANATPTSIELRQLRSADNEIYHLEGIGLEHNITFAIRYKKANLIGVKGVIRIRQEDYPKDLPFPVNTWLHLESPYYDATEMLGIAITANVHLTGKVFVIQKLKDKPAVFTTVRG